MSFCIYCHPLDEIPVAEILCLFCFALMKRNWTVFVAVSYYERKLHYSSLFKAKRRERIVFFFFLQSTRDNETWWDYSKIISNHCTHFCLLHFLKTAESHCRSSSFLRYHRHKSNTDSETGVSNLKLCMTFSTKPT